MKLQVTQENLSKALANVARIADTRSTLPILANVLLKTNHNRLSITTTNLDIAITQYVGSKVSEEGAITVPARLMQDFVTSLPNGVIDLSLSDNKLTVTTENYNSTINGIAAEDFPVMPTIVSGQSWKIATDAFKNTLGQVIFAASADDARPVLNGILIHNSTDKLYAAATDSYRLGEKRLLDKKAPTTSLLIPATALQDLLRVLSDEVSELSVTYDEQQVLFKVGDIELVARLIEGDYPQYQKLIPKDFTTTATLKREELLNIAKVSSLFARESAGSITINVDEDSQTVSIHSIASQLGENTATATATITGSGQITINSRYLLDGLHAFSGEDISFCFNGKLEPSLLKDPKNDDYLHIIMPLKS